MIVSHPTHLNNGTLGLSMVVLLFWHTEDKRIRVSQAVWYNQLNFSERVSGSLAITQ